MTFGEVLIPDVRLFHSKVQPGTRVYREHHHAECELSLLKSGSGIYAVGDKKYSFAAGDIFLFGSDEVHCITEIYDSEAFDVLNIHFSPRLLWSGGHAAMPLMALFSNRSSRFENRIDRENPRTEEIRRRIFEIEEEMKIEPVGYELKARLELYEILLLILRYYGYAESTPEAPPNSDTVLRLSAAMDYIDDHLSDRIRLDDIAKAAAMNRTYFSTVFKKYNGLSPWDYITIKRVEKAEQLLKNSDASKLMIAEECGFSSAANFYRAFARVTGKKPGDYAKNALQERSI